MFSRHAFSALSRHARSFSSTSRCDADFTHAVIGAGAVGLSIARRLQQVEGASVVLIEKHDMVGSETSSRNSEVIHAGLYYGTDSLKTRLCIKGKEMMYDYCKKNDVGFTNCGKWIVAQDHVQMGECQKVYDFAKDIGVPIRWVPEDEAKRREPHVRAEAGVLESTTTGIVDSHGFMQALQGDFENFGGTTALVSPVTRIEAPSAGTGDWKIWTASDAFEPSPSSPTPQTPEQSPNPEDGTFITAETVINSTGLYACAINNMILPPERHRTPYYAKGSYFTYSKSTPRTSTLIYPAPIPGLGGLGTHLTFDLGGQVRFGPDVEWVDHPHDLAPTPDKRRFEAALETIKKYMPGVDTSAISLGYAGIRPKLGRMSAVASGSTFQDFYIKKEEGYDGFVNLLGIESPGLTSSLAIGEEVYRLLYKAEPLDCR
ncbi:L-2-hydroxyglutarate dehydrogenase, mitochondrial [Fulvia fulva]|nr:L-2-hydroxyglutarate dehydrogenase, mitochondrial [Fulvia fulva]WPV26150.1 L-2-hydroxyglutarate dehydrogenase, mitochondrial [Fulvia fulva]